MERSLNLTDRTIAYTLKQSDRARRLRLSVHPGGQLIATAPKGVSFEKVEEFIYKKSHWVLQSIDRLSMFSPMRRRGTRADYLKHKEAARKLVETKMLKFNSIYGFKIGRIAIRDQKTRWGSCSAKGNLNFNYRIALLPDHLAEYIVVHELCHLGELNHSPRFWALVKKTVPHYREARRELSRTGLGLF